MDVLELIEDVEDETLNGADFVASIPRKYLVDVRNPFSLLDDESFAKRFRFSKQRVQYLYEILRGDQRLIVRAHALPPILQILCTLRFLATGHFQVTDGDLLGVSRHTARRSIHRVIRCIAARRHQFVVFPDNVGTVKEDFYAIAEFPRILGCIDGTHIPISSPGGNDAEVFRNRKGYFSLNVQMVCDPFRKITNIVVRWPGSAHDSRIFNNSVLKDKFEAGLYDGILLGDAGYPCRTYLMTPLPEPRTTSEKAYNWAHIQTRLRIEQAFGILKQRFRMLRIPIRMNLGNTIPAIVAAVCLHNFALRTGEPDPPQQLNDDYNHGGVEANDDAFENTASDSARGKATRQEIIRNYF